MVLRLDLNADVGEHDGPPPPSAIALLRVLTSASVACGGHAGDPTSMRLIVAEASALGVQVGAHPSYPDRDGFGRRALPLTPLAITDAVTAQVHALCEVADAQGASVRHVKPHGALYTDACRDRTVADAVVAGVLHAGAWLAVYAPQGSALWESAGRHGLRTIAEGFLDRAYEPDGALTPRSLPGAVIDDVSTVRRRAVEWARTGCVAVRGGGRLHLPVSTLCVHSDTPGALALACAVRDDLEAAGVRLLPSLRP